MACGLQTAALSFGGGLPAPTTTNLTDEYNGSTWTSGGTLITARMTGAAAGTQTAALCIAGDTGVAPTYPKVADVEEYNGSTWTAGTALPGALYSSAGMGTQTAALSVGGYPFPPGPISNQTLIFDGSTWTAGANNPISVGGNKGAGTTTAGLSFGGNTPSRTSTTTEYTGAGPVTKTITVS
jgi:hypothetical protein